MMGMSYEDARDWMRREAGDDTPRSTAWVPGENFDPSDEDDVAAVGLVMERDAYEAADYWRQRALRAERALDDNPYDTDPDYDEDRDLTYIQEW